MASAEVLENTKGPVRDSNAPDGVAVRAACLGCLLGASMTVAVLVTPTRPFLPLYVASLALFHLLEYWTTARYSPSHAAHSCWSSPK
jgi:hypothetical protein